MSIFELPIKDELKDTSMKLKNRYTITAALPYTNGPIHIGHLAGVYVPADIFSRYLRQKDKDVAFICGSDEHGVAIPMRAKKEGKEPQAIIDTYDKMIRESFERFGITFDNYSRTSRAIHHETASEFFKELHEKGVFEEQVSEQLYDEQAQQFLADRFVTGTCPKCDSPEAYGDQCEKCGTSLNATDLINPTSTLSGSKPSLKKTKHWFLPLNNFEGFLKDWILEEHKEDWKPNVYGQCKSWIDDGLKPRAVTRDLDWGIPVPAQYEGAQKVLYVWFEAPIGYISSTKEWAEREGKDWQPYWKDEETELVHFIGKDNIVFHCIIFPSILKAKGDYILPTQVPANEFLNLEGQKLSTSKNWAVWLHEYLEEFEGMQDVLRYALTANAPETKDNDFTWKDFQARNNNELVAIFGNFVNRVVVLMHKYYEGSVPEVQELNAHELEILAQLKDFPSKIESSLNRYRFREALGELMNLARFGNKYLADAEPWKRIKTEPDQVAQIMYTAIQIVGALAVLSEPFLPFTSAKLKGILGLEHTQIHWNEVAQESQLIKGGTRLNENQLLFRKIEDSEIEKQLEKLNNTKLENASEQNQTAIAEIKPTINFDDFSKLDLRVGHIISAEKMPKADKLLILQVDLGIEKRTVVSGIAQHFEPSEIVGKQVTLVANLAPRKLRGVESQGMILMTENAKGELVFVNPDQDDIPAGSDIT